MRRQRGFNLIELMVVVAIIGILAGLGYPMYTDHVLRGQVAEAHATLSDMRVRMEQYFQDNRTYDGAPICNAQMPTPKYFTVACTAGATGWATSYVVTLTGKPGNTQAFAFTVDEAGRRVTTATKSGWGTAPKNCWIAKKGGDCA